MALDIKLENSKWGNIKLVCSCDNDAAVPFILEQQGGLVMMKCNNKECEAIYPSELHIKALTDIEKWLKTHDSMDGFSSFFKRTLPTLRLTQNGFTTISREKCSIKLKYLKTIEASKTHRYHLIEITNITLQPEENLH